jgi:hypothetical protein
VPRRATPATRGSPVGGHAEDRKTIRHPDVGDITEDATKLALALVAGVR